MKVMTSVYGVTFIGAKDQIERQVKDYQLVEEEDYFLASKFLATLTLDAIKDLFSGAHAIKKWLIKCNRLKKVLNWSLIQARRSLGWRL